MPQGEKDGATAHFPSDAVYVGRDANNSIDIETAPPAAHQLCDPQHRSRIELIADRAKPADGLQVGWVKKRPFVIFYY